MATRIVEHLPIQSDRNTITNWIKRLTAGIELAIFKCKDKLPTDEEERKKDIEFLKKNMLIANIGGPGFGELSSLTAPVEPEKMKYDDLIGLLEEHYAPKPNLIGEEYRFSKLVQESGETLPAFYTRLKVAAQTCGFESRYDLMIRNRLICGIKNSKIREELLGCKDTSTASEVYELARTKEMEISVGNSIGTNSQLSVNHVEKRGQSYGKSNHYQRSGKSNQYKRTTSTVACAKCTLRGHSADNCRVKCRKCHKIGHIAKFCKLKKNGNKENIHNVSSPLAEGNMSSSETFESDPYFEDSHQNLYSLKISDPGFDGECFESCSTPFIPSSTPSDGESVRSSTPSSNSAIPSSTPSNGEIVRFSTCSVSTNAIKTKTEITVESKTESFNRTTRNDGNADFMLNSSNDVAQIDFIKMYTHNTPVVGNRFRPMLNVLVNGQYIYMEVDTGAAVSCISSDVFNRLELSGCVVSECNLTLCVANGQTLKSVKKATVSVKFKDVKRVLPLYIVDGKFPTLLGLEWIQSLFGKDWFERLTDMTCSVNMVQTHEKLINEIKASSIFEPGMGLITGYKANIDLKPGAKPVFSKFRQPPFAHMEAIGRKIDQLESEGILVKVDYSDYASPVLPVIKPDGDVRLCGDYKRTLNPNIDTAVYPLPVIEDCLWNVRGGELFTKLDIKAAYNHVPVREEDQILLTVNTHKGLYKFTRLPYGVCSASAIFQSIMDSVLRDIPGVTCRVDDILVTGKDDAEHFRNLRQVVDRLEKAGFRCRTDKSQFLMEEVVYLGHRVSKHGISPVKDKVETIVKAPYPETREELISFLGMIQYYSRYLPNLHNVIEPLNRLRSKSVPWHFDETEKNAFDKLKNLISSDRVLTFYDPDLPLRLDCDASSVGVGAVLSHMIDGVDRPIEFVSRTLKPAERNYSQIEREALAIVWAVKRFHRYLYARQFVLCTDHRPLEMIFDPYKSLSEVVSNRIQRWGIFLTSYRYTVEFRPTGKHANADMCSRYPVVHEEEPELEEINEMFSVDVDYSILSVVLGSDKPLLNAKLIAKMTRLDPVLSKVIHYVLEGWPERKETLPPNQKSKSPCGTGDRLVVDDERPSSPEDVEMRAFRLKQHEMSVDAGCLLWGSRVVIPVRMREKVLEMLHSTHMGMSSMKSLARGYLWWPGLDTEIERVARRCEACSLNQRLPNRAVPHPWIRPSAPWERVHIDFAGAFLGYMWLLIVDAYSKWLEVYRMPIGATKTSDTIKILRTVFCRYGLPKTCVSDGGPQFISDEMAAFMKRNGIHHIKSPPYSPASNGQIESLVGKFKAAMKKMKHHNPDVMLNLQNWLMSYHNTPHSATGMEPAVLMMGRRARTALSLLHPLHEDKRQVEREVSQTHRKFEAGDKVLFWNVLKKTWTPGVVTELEGSRVFKIRSQDGIVRKHLNHIVKDNTDLQGSSPPPPTGDAAEPEELEKPEINTEKSRPAGDLVEPVESEKPETVSEKSRTDLEHGSKPIVSKLPDHKPSLIESREPVITTNVPVVSASEPRSSTRPTRNTRPPDRLQYSKLGGG